MKKKTAIISVCIAVSVAVLAVIFLLSFEQTEMNFAQNGTVKFYYADTKIEEPLAKEDFDNLCKLFNGKLLVSDHPSCSFEDNISVSFNAGEQVFCIACDGCPVIYWKNKDRYFNISDNENRMLKEILQKYGCYFPCI